MLACSLLHEVLGAATSLGAQQQAPEWVVGTRPGARLERQAVLTARAGAVRGRRRGSWGTGRWEGASNNGSTLPSKREKGQRTPGWAKPHRGGWIDRSGRSK